MSISIFDLFTIGIGPSSSHTVGPMRAANRFIAELKQQQVLTATKRLQIDLYGSLALTGKGHSTDKAIFMGLEDQTPEGIDPDSVSLRYQHIISNGTLNLANQQDIPFSYDEDLHFHQRTSLTEHANGMRLSAYDGNTELYSNTYFSVGGGFVLDQNEIQQQELPENQDSLPFPFTSTQELMAHCETEHASIKEIMLANEKAMNPNTDIKARILEIAKAMTICIDNGCHGEGILPGGLEVRKRAPALYQKLRQQQSNDSMNWLNLYALAVNEENAMGGRVVTAPTNGAAGILPAVLQYLTEFTEHKDEECIINYLLTAAAIAILYKKGASISAAEVGCQGEVGVACSMAAGALTAVQGGTLIQIENAAEIGMEHNLGLTCDPIKGLVQIPCIERNAMGAIQAVNASKLALLEDRRGKISLDMVIATMLQTGRDMSNQYKETSQGGLAVNLPGC